MGMMLGEKLYRLDKTMLEWYCPGCEMMHPARIVKEAGQASWTWDGSEEKPTFHPSFVVKYTRHDKNVLCHSFVIEGRIRYLTDSTHGLSGQIVDLPDVPQEHR